MGSQQLQVAPPNPLDGLRRAADSAKAAAPKAPAAPAAPKLKVRAASARSQQSAVRLFAVLLCVSGRTGRGRL